MNELNCTIKISDKGMYDFLKTCIRGKKKKRIVEGFELDLVKLYKLNYSGEQLTLNQQERLYELSGQKERCYECRINKWDEVEECAFINILDDNIFTGKILKYISKRHKYNIEVTRYIAKDGLISILFEEWSNGKMVKKTFKK